MNTLLTIGLILAASISQLLTLITLWQLKEWRIDRLYEHLRREGTLGILFGRIRPVLLIVLFSKPEILLPALAVLNLIQILLRKQRFPVWTSKAMAITLLSIGITIITSFGIWDLGFGIWNLVPFVQPIIITLAWTTLVPLDIYLKRRILKRAKAVRSLHPDITVIGITGSVGKTTTKQLLSHILSDQDIATTPAYVNAEIGVARWIIGTLEAKNCPKYLICEMGAYRKGEIALLCDTVQPTIGIVTFIGTQHIALFGSQRALCEAKAELIKSLPKDGHAFVNNDSALCANMAEQSPCPTTTVGTGGHADIEAFGIEETSTGIRFTTHNTVFILSLHGTQNVTNVLLAIATASHLGLEYKDIANKLRTFTPPEHTFSVRKEGNCTILDDTHNASPESFKSALTWARSQPIENKVLLSAGLIELGAEQDRICNELGALASQICDRVIFTTAKAAEPFAKHLDSYEVVQKDTKPVPDQSLVLCIGRMKQSTIQQVTSNA
ncbi:MAG: UDP-N-acetylmuramoyl-tripeptide--D-alanyl-D-alanine ligase [bacterium]|nr:UDP-N-acetylmuramoyl-tripeptide--D-alanyl-D-alanine ligase [bacterium]